MEETIKTLIYVHIFWWDRIDYRPDKCGCKKGGAGQKKMGLYFPMRW
jgi:hypothetical protein